MKTTVTIKKKYAEGSGSVTTKKVVAKKSKPIDTYTRETTSTEETTPATKGKLYIKEGTVQRKPTGGVGFVSKEDEGSISKNGKIVDPKSGKTESSNQSSLRKATLDVHKDVDLSKRYKEGDSVTYDTKKGKQVAGKVTKTPDTPATYKTTTEREIEVRKKGDVKNSNGNPKLGDQYKSQGYKNIPGTYNYKKDDESKFVPESEVDKHIKMGYSRSDSTKKNLDKKAKGVKEIKKLKFNKR